MLDNNIVVSSSRRLFVFVDKRVTDYSNNNIVKLIGFVCLFVFTSS